MTRLAAARGWWRSLAADRRPTAGAGDAGGQPSFAEAERSLLDLERLQRIARAHRDAYASATPFPHAVIDGLFDDAVLERVRREFSTESPRSITERLDRHVAGKRSLRDHPDHAGFSPFVRFFVSHLNSIFLLGFLRELTGIPDLISDPYLDGAGLHETFPGGWLDVHADFNFHGACFLDRRVNLLVYLNRGWREEWGGELELWDRDLAACAKRVAPVFNRTVVFNTSDVSFHGHPDPVRCPPGESRKSIALYYFSNGRPEAERSPWHSTIWRGGD
ncbi:MAG TPA: 2OG-Fe(II) oxygenase [Candidatus Binatia bacterium]|nr:2OG-Fe(II) oxygenase [Candidatus Binatia bacterium]